MSTNTNIETKLKEFRKYLLDEIDRRAPDVENCEYGYGEYDRGAFHAFIDIEKRLYDKILHELTHECN